MSIKPLHILLTAAFTLGLSASAIAQPGERGPEPGPDGPKHERDGEGPPPRHDRAPGGEREHRGKFDRHSRGGGITVEMLDEAIATVRELHAGEPSRMVDGIVELAKKDPQMAARRLSYYPRLREMMDARKNQPDEFKLHVRQTTHMRKFLRAIKSFYDAKREKDQAKMDELRPKVREQVEAMLQVRLEMRRIEIKKLKERIKKMEEEVAKIENDAPSLVDEKMKQIEKGRDGKHKGKGGDGRPDRGDKDRSENGKEDRPERKRDRGDDDAE